MKRFSIIALLIVLVSFLNKKNNEFSLHKINHDYEKVKTDLYVCKYEVSNLDYRSFLTDLNNSNNYEDYKFCLPDTTCWREKITYNEPFVNYYFQHPSYNDYPVVGVSYEMANKYCSWLTQKYNLESKRKFKKVIFKLLSNNEWIFAANNGDTTKAYTWGSGFMQNNRKQYLCNFKHTVFVFDSTTKIYTEWPASDSISLNNRASISGPVKSFYPSTLGMYNMCGNVAEMIEEKGIAKGGSYADPAYLVRIASEKSYLKPTADIGFRVCMKIIEK